MKIKAEIVGDSKNEFGGRITTIVCTYPRIIHAEIMTHRMFSRNAASSRAVPAQKLIDAVKDDPFIPFAFQKAHSGMQGTEYITDPDEIKKEIADWLDDRDYLVKKAEARLARGVTKQLINRPLEPFQWYTCIITATEWENFFALRCPQYHSPEKYMTNPPKPVKIYRSWKDITQDYLDLEQDASILTRLSYNKGQAEIHMMTLAEAMWDAMNESTPKLLESGEWHIPFEDKIEDMVYEALDESGGDPDKYKEIDNNEITDLKIKISTVMAARTSYTVVGDDLKPMTVMAMSNLHDKLVSANPLHASPMEHCAKAMNEKEMYAHVRGIDSGMGHSYDFSKNDHGWSGNFQGFIQYRKMFKNENVTK